MSLCFNMRKKYEKKKMKRKKNQPLFRVNHSMLRWTRHLAPAVHQAMQQVPSPPGPPLRQVCQQLPQLRYADVGMEITVQQNLF